MSSSAATSEIQPVAKDQMTSTLSAASAEKFPVSPNRNVAANPPEAPYPSYMGPPQRGPSSNQNPQYPGQQPQQAQQTAYPVGQGYPGYGQQAPPQQAQQTDPAAYPVGQAGYPGYGQQAPGGVAYDQTKQAMVSGVGGPPPYYTQQQPMQSQYNGGTQPQNVIVVAQQPTTVPTTVQVVKSKAGQGPFIAATIVTGLAVFFGCWWSLVCSIPAIAFASNATSAGNTGDMASVKKNNLLSCGCTIGAIVSGVVGLIIIIGAVAGVLSSSSVAVLDYIPSSSFCYSSLYRRYGYYC